MEKRKYLHGAVAQLTEEGVISPEQGDEIKRRYPVTAQEPITGLRLDLAPVLASWNEIGPVASFGGGGMTMPVVVDHRASLIAPRLAWLDEEQIFGTERQFYRSCWRALDETFVEVQREQLAKALEKD